jgi:pimeloyl-ACP methyl ester carboxylesterase
MQRRDLEVITPDGRRLVGEVSGPDDGALLIYHHGCPGSHYLFERDVEYGAERGLRHVCYSRAGYGASSDRLPGRSFADGAADAAAVADALGVDRFYVVGYSCGGPHALACATLLPERVIAALAMGSLAPRAVRGSEWMAGTGEWNDDEFAALERGDAELERLIRVQAERLAEVRTREKLLEVFGDLVCEADRECLVGPFLDFQTWGCRRAVDGDIWGWFDDDKASHGDWGFDPAQVCVPVSLWHGEADKMVPVAESECLAELMPAAELHLLPGEGHVSLGARHYAAALDELITLG